MRPAVHAAALVVMILEGLLALLLLWLWDAPSERDAPPRAAGK